MHLPTILAVLSAKPIGGIFNEMLSLIGIATIIVAIFRGIKSLMPQPPAALPQPPVMPQPATAPPPAPVTPQAAPPMAAEGVTPEILAVICAAVAAASSSARRIVSVRSQDPMWEKAGRQSILTSHRIR